MRTHWFEAKRTDGVKNEGVNNEVAEVGNNKEEQGRLGNAAKT